MNDAFASKENSYRLRFPRRSSWLARIGNPLGPAKTAGWPGDVRGGILRRSKTQSPRLRRMDADEFRAQARPSTVRHAPMSDVAFRISHSPRRSGKRGCAGRLRVEHVLETPSHPAAEGGKLLILRRQDARANVAGPAKCLLSAGGFTHSSWSPFIGTNTVTENHLPSYPSFRCVPVAILPAILKIPSTQPRK